MEKEDCELEKYRSKLQHSQLDKALNYLSSTYNTNLQAQEIYLDILKRNRKNIDSRYIKIIYGMFSENKACEICFEKEAQKIEDFDERMIGRYYSRIIEVGIRKISYFWHNSNKLGFLFPAMNSFVKQIYEIVHEINKIKNLDYHKNILKLLFAQNSLIEQRVFNLLIDEGFLASMDEFYRINGIDLTTDQFFERKNLPEEIIEEQDEEEVSSLENLSYRRITQKTLGSKSKINTKKKVCTREFCPIKQSQPVSRQSIENDKNEIKLMFESIIKTLKDTMQQKRQQKIEVSISRKKEKRLSSIKNQADKQKMKEEIDKKGRISPHNTIKNFPMETRKVPKKLSIELMNYFSNEFKTLIEETDQPEINCLSELIVTSQSNKSRKKIKQIIGLSQSMEPKIHSSQSLNMLRDHKRGKMLERLSRNKYDELSDVWDSFSIYGKLKDMEKDRKRVIKQKFSLKSAPGMYISVKTNNSSTVKGEQKQKGTMGKKFMLHQNYHCNKKLFQNELLTSQFFQKQLKKNGENSVSVLQNSFGLGFGITADFLQKKLNRQGNNSKKRGLQNFSNKIRVIPDNFAKVQKLRILQLNQQKLSTNLLKMSAQNKYKPQYGQAVSLQRFPFAISDQNKNLTHTDKISSVPRFRNNNGHPVFTIYDRARRKIYFKQ